MVRFFIVIAGLFSLFCLPLSPYTYGEFDPAVLIEDVNSGKISFPVAQERCRGKLEIVSLSGKVFNFAPNIITPETPVNDVLVYIAEFPLARHLNFKSDQNGCWTMPVYKFKHTPLAISLIFEKEGFVTAKSNVHTVTDDNIDSIAMQFPSTAYYEAAIAQIEQQISTMTGVPYTIKTLTVATVGKSWASMYVNRFPHGDPGATVTVDAAVTFPALGPIYFNESVTPDPTQKSISNDGGVLFANLPAGTFTFNAHKDTFVYSPVTFTVEDGVGLYIASPPHSLQGNNGSGPGEW
jgi:hypothetical protein